MGALVLSNSRNSGSMPLIIIRIDKQTSEFMMNSEVCLGLGKL